MEHTLCKTAGVFVFAVCFLPAAAFPAAPTQALLKAKQEAESKGYLFETSRDEFITKAKMEAKLRVLSGLDRSSIKPVREAFTKKYPFLDFHIEEITGTDANQRFLMELKAGMAKGWDASHLSVDALIEYPPYLKKFDLLGMAGHGVLNLPLQVIDPERRNMVAVTSNLQVLAYNKKLVPEDRVPYSWEGLLDSQFKGRKLLVDIRPTEVAALVPAWGLEKTLDFARKLGAQQPIWARGSTLLVGVAGRRALHVRRPKFYFGGENHEKRHDRRFNL